jgi:hypothetical protein
VPVVWGLLVDSVTRPDQDDIDRALDEVRMGLRDLSLPGEDPFGAIEQIAAEVVALRAELAEANERYAVLAETINGKTAFDVVAERST